MNRLKKKKIIVFQSDDKRTQAGKKHILKQAGRQHRLAKTGAMRPKDSQFLSTPTVTASAT
jgi:hypothetical protein